MTSSVAWNMAWALIAVIAIFALAAGTKRTVSIGVLLVLIPFQQIHTPYASSSVLIAYVLAAVLLIQGGLKLRMLPSIAMIIFAYFASFALANDPSMRLWHMTFMFQFFSCFVVFLLAYNFALLVENGRSIFDVLLATNVLAILYCGVQLWVGPGESFVPFGIEELALNKNRHAGDPRLVGPFDNPGTTGGYFTLMVLVCAVDLMFAQGRRRWLLWAVVVCNLFGLVATGNRASFLVLLAIFPAMLFVFRRAAWHKESRTVLGGRRVGACRGGYACRDRFRIQSDVHADGDGDRDGRRRSGDPQAWAGPWRWRKFARIHGSARDHTSGRQKMQKRRVK